MIHILGSEFVHFFLLEEDGEITLIDAGLSGYRERLSWVGGVIDDLRSGALTWSWELADMAKSFLPEAGITTAEQHGAR